MDFIVDKPWGMHVLFGVIAGALWLTVWFMLCFAGKFDKIPGKGIPLLFLGFLPCIPFGAIVCALGFLAGSAVAVMWMLNAGFGWFEGQMIAVKSAFTKVEAESVEESQKKPRRKSTRSKREGK